MTRRIRIRRLRRRSAEYGDDPRGYWNARHRAFRDDLRGVGAIGIPSEGNKLDYDLKVTRVHDGVRSVAQQGAKSALEAGCGTGMFTEVLVQEGFDVTAIDFSSTAIDEARTRVPSVAEFKVADLTSTLDLGVFDLVLCVDVLFHVVDDHAWSRALENLGSWTRIGGWLLIQEHLVDEADSSGHGHVRWRTEHDYASGLKGFDLVSRDHYLLVSEQSSKDLLLWRKMT